MELSFRLVYRLDVRTSSYADYIPDADAQCTLMTGAERSLLSGAMHGHVDVTRFFDHHALVRSESMMPRQLKVVVSIGLLMAAALWLYVLGQSVGEVRSLVNAVAIAPQAAPVEQSALSEVDMTSAPERESMNDDERTMRRAEQRFSADVEALTADVASEPSMIRPVTGGNALIAADDPAFFDEYAIDGFLDDPARGHFEMADYLEAVERHKAEQKPLNVSRYVIDSSGDESQ
jgi:hypothetical protein